MVITVCPSVNHEYPNIEVNIILYYLFLDYLFLRDYTAQENILATFLNFISSFPCANTVSW